MGSVLSSPYNPVDVNRHVVNASVINCKTLRITYIVRDQFLEMYIVV